MGMVRLGTRFIGLLSQTALQDAGMISALGCPSTGVCGFHRMLCGYPGLYSRYTVVIQGFDTCTVRGMYSRLRARV